MIARKLIALALLGSAALAGPAAAKDTAKDTAVWSSYVDEQAASINFATPESDDVRFVLYCEHASRKVSVILNQSPGRAKLNDPLTIEMSVGATKLSLAGTAVADKNEGYLYGQAKDVPVGAATDLLRTPGVLKVKMAGKSHSFPDKGRAKNLKVFEDGCKAK